MSDGKNKTIFAKIYYLLQSVRLKKFLLNISKWFFLLLFREFFGSNTFFSHAHIVDGYTIVHSHPFRHNNNGAPVHDHPINGYLLINLLIHFSELALSLWFTERLFTSFSRELSKRYFSALRLQSFQIPALYRGPPQNSF